MNAGTIVGYVTQRDGSPVSGANIWISPTGAFGGAAEIKSVAKTDSRGYFQLTLGGAGVAEVVGSGGNLNVSVGAEQDGRANMKNRVAPENRFQVSGYFINQNLPSDI